MAVASAPATTETSAAPAPQAQTIEVFETELDCVEQHVLAHQIGGLSSPAASLWLQEAKKLAYLSCEPSSALEYLRRARVAALRYHAGQSMSLARGLQEKLGQRASRQGVFVLGYAKIALSEHNLLTAIKYADQALDLFQIQVESEAIVVPAPEEKAPERYHYQLSGNTAPAPSKEVEALNSEGERHVTALRNRRRGKKNPDQAKKHRKTAA